MCIVMANDMMSIYVNFMTAKQIWQGLELSVNYIQSNFDGSNIFGTIENCSRYRWFEPLRVNYGAKSGSKWR